jgi:multiple sugar transport system substrate-binding protein
MDEVSAGDAIIKDRFVKQFPHLTVNVEQNPSTDRDTKLVAEMAAGTAPDVFPSWRDNVTQFSDRGQVLDVEPLVKRDIKSEELKDFYPWQWRGFVLPNGSRYGMPWYVNVMMLRYNKTLFERAGLRPPDDTWTHDTYREAAMKLTSWRGDEAVSVGLYYPAWSWDRFWYKIEAWGGVVVDPRDDTRAVFDSAEGLEAMEWCRKLLWDHRAMAPLPLVTATGSATLLFGTGRLGMMEEGGRPKDQAEALKGQQISWAYTHAPRGPKQRRVLGTSDAWVIWKDTKAPEGAWQLVRFASGPDYQINQARAGSRLPARYSALGEWKRLIVEQYPEMAETNLEAWIQAMEMGYPGHRQLFKRDADARQIVEPALRKLFIEGDTPTTYLKEIAQQVTAKMRQ